MKKISVISSLRQTAFCDSTGALGLLGKTLLFLLLLSLFILLFCLRGCQSGSPTILGPEQRLITPAGDTLVGQNPRLMDPAVPRNCPINPKNGVPETGTPGDGGSGERTPGGYIPDDGTPVDWPVPVSGEKDPGLPDKKDNQIPPFDPEDRIENPETGTEIDSRHLFVILDSDVNDETFNRFSAELSNLYSAEDCSIVYYNTLSKTILLQVNPEERESIKNNLPDQITDISFYVVEVEMLQSDIHPNDKAFSYEDCCWQFEPIQAYEAWDITTGSRDVTVAIIDSYFDLYHPDLDGVRVVNPYSVERGTNNVLPTPDLILTNEGAFLHGTHVAGIVFGEINNIEGSCGIAPSCSFMPISLGQNLSSYAQIEGILYAIYKGASVINLSMGLYFNPDFISRMTIDDQVEISQRSYKEKEMLWDYIFKLCEERNVTIVWSAGNQNVLSAMDSSKRNQSTVKVDAVDKNLRKAEFSNFGIIPEYGVNNSTISAPGCSIMSTIPYGDYFPLDGTSMAAPIITGAVALMKSLNRNLKNEEVTEILRSTAKPLEDNNIGGLVQIKDALEMVQSDFLKFDDVMSNHELLIGEWESTTNLSVIRNNEETGEHSKRSIKVTSVTNGTSSVQYVDGDNIGAVCSAPVTITFMENKIVIKETKQPASPSGLQFVKSVWYCTPDSQGYLCVSLDQETFSEAINFHLRKIN